MVCVDIEISFIFNYLFEFGDIIVEIVWKWYNIWWRRWCYVVLEVDYGYGYVLLCDDFVLGFV